MVDMDYPLSSQTSDDDPTGRQGQNQRRADFLHLGKVEKLSVDGDGEGDPQAVNIAEFLERYIYNCRPALLGTTQIRVAFTGDRPATIMINGFMLQSIADVDSAVYSGASGTIFIMAIRTVDSTTFTIALRTSATEGTDERLIGQIEWDGSAFDGNLLSTYELEGFGLQVADAHIVKAWVSFTGSTGVILNSHDITSVVRDSVGRWTITWETAFVDTTYAIVGSAFHATSLVSISIIIISANSITVNCKNQSGTLIDPISVYIMAIGDQV